MFSAHSEEFCEPAVKLLIQKEAWYKFPYQRKPENTESGQISPLVCPSQFISLPVS